MMMNEFLKANDGKDDKFFILLSVICLRLYSLSLSPDKNSSPLSCVGVL